MLIAEETMRNRFSIVALLLFAYTAVALAQESTTSHDHPMSPPAPAAAAADWAMQRVDRSPRHHEWVKVKSGDRTVSAFVVYPEVSSKATSVVVIHEIFGMSTWVQMLTDELAEAGYVAIAPDLLSGLGPHGGGTSDFVDGNAVGKAIRDLPPDQITADLNAVADYVAKLPAANGKVIDCVDMRLIEAVTLDRQTIRAIAHRLTIAVMDFEN